MIAPATPRPRRAPPDRDLSPLGAGVADARLARRARRRGRPEEWTPRTAPMKSVNLRRIRCADPAAPQQLAALRAQLSAQADVVSPRGRQLTEAVFGEPLPPTRVVERICAD